MKNIANDWLPVAETSLTIRFFLKKHKQTKSIADDWFPVAETSLPVRFSRVRQTQSKRKSTERQFVKKMKAKIVKRNHPETPGQRVVSWLSAAASWDADPFECWKKNLLATLAATWDVG